MKRPSLAVAIAATLALSAHANPPPEIPVDTLFQTSTLSQLQFSPDGKRILCLIPYQHRQNLMVIDLEKKSRNLLSSFNDRDATSPFWASDNRILFLVDDEGKEQFELYAVNADGSDPSILVPERPISSPRRIKGDPRSILVQAAITHSDWWDVAKMNLKSGKLSTPIARAPGEVSDYTYDHDNVVRFAHISDSSTRMNRVLYRDANGQEWREVGSSGFDQPGWSVIGFDGDNRIAYVASDVGRATSAVYRYDTATHQMESEPVFADPTYDVGNIVYDAFKKKVVGVAYEGDRLRFHWIDDEMKAIHARMEQSLPDTVHSPVQFSEDGSRIIFFSYSDRDPGVYYVYDRKRQRVEELAVVAPKIDPGQMSPTKAVSYRARDGLEIHAFLTVPAGREPRNLPLVVHPHGGPYGIRDDWGYNPEVQFYANRGFAVLQINYRGSGGYGQGFESAGFKKWGLEMQDDLTDGVKWAVASGVADPKRVVISGASYGGYATMAGLTFTPELYCAGINYVGVVNIENLIPKAVSSRRMYWMHTRLGNLLTSEDRKRIHDTSPVHFADRIRVPLLMAYGRNDPRVPIEQAYDIERALKRNNRPYELIIEDKEGHGFRQEEKRIAFYKRVDGFLKLHVLGGRTSSSEVILGQLEMPATSTGG
ncbi:MAG: hypothetical protein C0518_10615 [Opitutus sp.]|nr:hypothetical protein [Opitutus sp.]